MGGVAIGIQPFYSTIAGKKPVIVGVAVTPVDSVQKNAVILFGDVTKVLGPFGSYAKQVLHANSAALVYPNIAGITDGAAAIAKGLTAAAIAAAVSLTLAAVGTSLWAVSTDNLSRRSAAELLGILAAIEAKVAALAGDPRIHQRRVRVKAAGRLEMLPASTVAAIRAAEEATAGYDDGLALTIAVAYGGHDEITDAVRALLREAADEGKPLADAIEAVTPAAIARHLYMAELPDPDLIIRRSGENRLSGFLLWQSAYSELYFTDVNWPAFRKIDFLRAVRAFQQRKRRFGG